MPSAAGILGLLLGRFLPPARARCRPRARPSLLELEDRRLLASAAFDLIGLTALRNDAGFAGIDGSGVTVAVIDSGIDYTHPLLNPAIFRAQDASGNIRLVGRDFARGDDDPNDLLGHGTHVAGTIGARDADIGVAPQVRLIGLKLSDTPSMSGQAIESALRWVIDNQPRYNILVVNMSIGGGYYNTADIPTSIPYYDEVRQLEQMGVTVVSSAGNSYKYVSDNADSQFGGSLRMVGSPAIFSTLSVGAVWQDGVRSDARWASGAIDHTTGADRVASFSQRGDTAGVLFAPGAMITSTLPGNRTGPMAGTSMAAPVVSGVAALLQDAAFTYSRGTRYLTPTEVRDILLSTADVINDGDNEDDNVRNTGINFRRVNAYRAVQEVHRRLDTPPPPPPPPASGDRDGTLATAVNLGDLTRGPALIREGTIGTDAGADAGSADVDLFRINLPTAGALSASASGLLRDPANAVNPVLRLFDSVGAPLTASDATSASSFPRVSANLAAGTYYVGVSGFSNARYNPASLSGRPSADTGDYLLTIGLTSSDPNGLLDGATPFSVFDPPTVYHFGMDGGTLRRDASGRFPTTGGPSDLYVPGSYTEVGSTDVDLYRFRAPANGYILLKANPFLQDNAAGNWSTFNRFPSDPPTMKLWDLTADGSPLPWNPRDIGGWYDEHYSRLYWPIEGGHEYLLGISSGVNTWYDPTSLSAPYTRVAGTTGFYELSVTFEHADTDGTIRSDGPVVDPTNPSYYRWVDWIGQDGATAVDNLDVDIHRIRSPRSGLLEFQVESFGLSGILAWEKVDAVLQLFDSTGRRLALADDTNGLDPLLRYDIQADTDYFLAVSGSPNTSFNPFVRGSGVPSETGRYAWSARLLPESAVRANNNNSLASGTPRAIQAGQSLTDQLGADQTAEQVAAGYAGAGSAGVKNLGQDIDLFAYQAAQNEVVTVRATPDVLGGTELDVSADVILRVFDSASRLVAESTISGALGNVLQFQAAAGQTYYIGVSGYGAGDTRYNPLDGQFAARSFAGSTGAYRLSLDATPLPVVLRRGDVTSQVSVTQVRQMRRGNRLTVTLRLQNNGATVAGPIALVLAVPRDVRLIGGTRFGGPAKGPTQSVRTLVSSTALGAGQGLTVDLAFRLRPGARGLRLGEVRVLADG